MGLIDKDGAVELASLCRIAQTTCGAFPSARTRSM